MRKTSLELKQSFHSTGSLWILERSYCFIAPRSPKESESPGQHQGRLCSLIPAAEVNSTNSNIVMAESRKSFDEWWKEGGRCRPLMATASCNAQVAAIRWFLLWSQLLGDNSKQFCPGACRRREQGWQESCLGAGKTGRTNSLCVAQVASAVNIACTIASVHTHGHPWSGIWGYTKRQAVLGCGSYAQSLSIVHDWLFSVRANLDAIIDYPDWQTSLMLWQL